LEHMKPGSCGSTSLFHSLFFIQHLMREKVFFST
jgi:hypothetical protein